MKCTIAIVFGSVALCNRSICAWLATAPSRSVRRATGGPGKATKDSSRRIFLQSLTLPFFLSTFPRTIFAAASDDVVVTLTSFKDKLGLELFEISIGSPPRPVVAVRSVTSRNTSLRPGLVLRDYTSLDDVKARLQQTSSYPVELRFYNLAAQGDAIADDGTPLVTAQDALNLATSSPRNAKSLHSEEYRLTVTQKPASCPMLSRRNDVLEIVYEARVANARGRVYDASTFRGTGRPYQMVLGSGDMLPGVDQGLYDACPGEARVLEIPPPVAYGSKGNKMFGIPPDTNLWWSVQVVSINGVQQGDATSREEMEGRVPYQ